MRWMASDADLFHIERRWQRGTFAGYLHANWPIWWDIPAETPDMQATTETTDRFSYRLANPAQDCGAG